MQTKDIISFFAATAAIGLMCSCRMEVPSPDTSRPTVHAQPGQTIKQLVDSLPSTGGTVLLAAGTWSSGYSSTAFITKPNVTIQGAGMPGFNSTFTAMSGGTIVKGLLTATSGADYLSLLNLGIDTGKAYIDTNTGRDSNRRIVAL